MNGRFKLSEPEKMKLLKLSNTGVGVFYYVLRLALLVSIGFIIIYPLLYMIVTSVMSPISFNNSTRVWIPSSFNIKDNYEKAFIALNYLDGLWNTIRYEVVSALLEIVTCAIVGYGFARFDFKGKKIFSAILFLTILVPDMTMLIPRMANYANLDFLGILGGLEKLIEWIASLFGADISAAFDLTPNVVNTGWTMWLPSLFANGLRSGVLIYIYIQFFTSLPRELEEAAWVDGAGPLKTFLRIAVPSSSVVFITVSVFSIVWHWNDSLLSGMYFTDGLPLASSLVGAEAFMGAAWGLYGGRSTPQQAAVLMAICILFITPILIFYLIVQRGFVESIDRVGITG